MKASVIIVNKDGKEDLKDSLQSLLSQTVDNYEVILVDNNSTDGSVSYVREKFPEVRVLTNDENRWYAGGNNDGFAIANGEFVAVVNPDVEVDERWLEALIEPIEQEEAEITTSKILYHENPDLVNACGNLAHYTGLGFCRGLKKEASEYEEKETVSSVSGCSFATTQKLLEEFGGFDEDFEFYFEDLDFSWRAHLTGRKILFQPESVVYHKYDRPLPPWRFFNMERNRHLLLFKHLQFRTLFLMLPALLLTEVLMWGLAALKGKEHTRAKAQSYSWSINNFGTIKEKRGNTQKLREQTDEKMLENMTVRIPLGRFGVPKPLATPLTDLLIYLYEIPYKVITE